MKQDVGQSVAIDGAAYAPSAPGREKTHLPDDGWEVPNPPDRQRRTLVDRAVSSPHARLDGELVHDGRAPSRLMAERKRALATSERRAYRLIDSNVIGIAFATGERVTEANDEFLRTIRYSGADLDAGLSWRDMTPPEYRDLDDRCLAELERRGECTPLAVRSCPARRTGFVTATTAPLRR